MAASERSSVDLTIAQTERIAELKAEVERAWLHAARMENQRDEARVEVERLRKALQRIADGRVPGAAGMQAYAQGALARG